MQFERLVVSTYKELADVGSTLGTETLGNADVGKAGDLAFTLLNNDEGKGSNVGTDNATADSLTLSLTGLAGAVARVTLGEQETGTSGTEDTLLHGETLLVVSTSDLKDVTLELITESVSLDLSGHTLVVEDTTEVKKCMKIVGKSQLC
jgi:hypothetical protein